MSSTHAPFRTINHTTKIFTKSRIKQQTRSYDVAKYLAFIIIVIGHHLLNVLTLVFIIS